MEQSPENDSTRFAIEEFCGYKHGIVRDLGKAANRLLVKVGDKIVSRLSLKPETLNER